MGLEYKLKQTHIIGATYSNGEPDLRAVLVKIGVAIATALTSILRNKRFKTILQFFQYSTMGFQMLIWKSKLKIEEESWTDSPGGLDGRKIFLVILPAGPASEAFLNYPEIVEHDEFTTWFMTFLNRVTY